MPLYTINLHLAGGQFVPDVEPAPFTDDSAALDEARRAALEIAGDALRAQQRPLVTEFEVKREDGTSVGTVCVEAEAIAQLRRESLPSRVSSRA